MDDTNNHEAQSSEIHARYESTIVQIKLPMNKDTLDL